MQPFWHNSTLLQCVCRAKTPLHYIELFRYFKIRKFLPLHSQNICPQIYSLGTTKTVFLRLSTAVSLNPSKSAIALTFTPRNGSRRIFTIVNYLSIWGFRWGLSIPFFLKAQMATVYCTVSAFKIMYQICGTVINEHFM